MFNLCCLKQSILRSYHFADEVSFKVSLRMFGKIGKILLKLQNRVTNKILIVWSPHQDLLAIGPNLIFQNYIISKKDLSNNMKSILILCIWQWSCCISALQRSLPAVRSSQECLILLQNITFLNLEEKTWYSQFLDRSISIYYNPGPNLWLLGKRTIPQFTANALPF